MEIYFNNDNKLILSGRISKGDFQKLEQILKDFPLGNELNISLKSRGGNISAVVMPATKIEMYKTKIFVEEFADSAALLLLAVGDKRYAKENATFLFHLPRNIETGNSDIELAEAKASILANYIKISEKEILNLMVQNKNIDVYRAIEIGLIDKIY